MPNVSMSNAEIAGQIPRETAERGAAGARAPGASGAIVHVFGTVFFDLVFTGLSAPPRPGTEVRTDHLGLTPGGVANVAVALARLGVRVRLSSAFADDAFGRYLWAALEHEGIDLSPSWRVSGWTTPLTVSMAYGRERSMVTHERPGERVWPPDEGGDACFVGLGECDPDWLGSLRRRFSLVVADTGWDPEERWAPEVLGRLGSVDLFLPNAAEAQAYTRRHDVEAAALALAEHVPLVVVTCGAEGALAAGAGAPAGEVVRERALPVEALDTTGAGDVFDAGFLYATLSGWPLRRRLRFANLCAGESVAYAGGSLSAPCWRDLAAWWDRQEDPGRRRDFAFLAELLDSCRPARTCERPCASLTVPGELGQPAEAG